MVKIEATDKRILYIIHLYGRPMPRDELHRVVYELKRMGVRIGVDFPEGITHSVKLQRRVDSLVSRGYIREIYVVGPSYLDLYVQCYELSDKGLKVVENLDIDKRDKTKIEEYMKSLGASGPAGGSPQEDSSG